MAATHAPSHKAHPVFDTMLLALATALVILAMLAALVALAVAVTPAGGHIGIGWLSFRQEVVRLLGPAAPPHRR
jgi:hypothetical protein